MRDRGLKCDIGGTGTGDEDDDDDEGGKSGGGFCGGDGFRDRSSGSSCWSVRGSIAIDVEVVVVVDDV